MQDFLQRLQDSNFSYWVSTAPTLWAYPTILTLHTIGLAMVVGPNAVLDLRLLGAGSRVPIAELRLQSEIQIDQEALHFDPVEGRGFVPHGALTSLRRSVYPASVHGRPSSHEDRERREHESIVKRVARFFDRV